MNAISFAKVKRRIRSGVFTKTDSAVMHQAVTTPAGAPVVPRKRRPRRKRDIFIGVGALLLLLIIAGIINAKREKPIPVTTEKASRRNILQTVSETGKVQPEVEVKISPEVAGENTKRQVTEWKAVKNG